MVSKQQQMRNERYKKLLQKVADEHNLFEIIVENSGTLANNSAKQQFCPEKIIKTFSEIMKNMNKMRVCTRPTMCKPYGKQSESLQKTLNDTIHLVRSLRTFLPPPHIAVGSWKTEDKHRYTTIKIFLLLFN
ncbi:Hypothetical protein CINCED_3A022560 [Cinara cedri]|uniref:Uncharacterized protein n=1 Tax=Cinara cedri TaxID=506608 RepID=A0A5E4NJ08_9HEMI|nr:Hypothetical protein CINCED_3A022560 [Cinara cedri]